MKLYYKFRNSSLDTAPLGIVTGNDTSEFVYTPSGARIIGWMPGQNIHFCQVEGFGGTVFVVDPNAPPGDCVHPVANSLCDFIGLLTACKHAVPICNAYRWSRSLFRKTVQSIRPDYRCRSILRALENTYHPHPISDPYLYIRSIQQGFDYTALPLHPDYFEWCPIRPGNLKWEVGFGTGFSEWCEKGKAGQELSIRRNFRWQKEEWSIAAVYLCEEGIVVDSFLQVSPESLTQFHQKWDHRTGLSIEEQMLRDLDDPLNIPAKGTLLVNDRIVPLKSSSFLRWDPTLDNPWNARRTLDYYGLDREKGYLLRRESFLRRGKNPPIRTMELKLEVAPAAVPGQRFVSPAPGESLSFRHPASGQMHTLKVVSLTREALDPNFLSNHPCCYTRLVYTLDPAISGDCFSIVDCDAGDQAATNSPAASLLTGKIPSAGQFAVSSLRYTPADSITWRMIFRHKTRQDLSVRILP